METAYPAGFRHYKGSTMVQAHWDDTQDDDKGPQAYDAGDEQPIRQLSSSHHARPCVDSDRQDKQTATGIRDLHPPSLHDTSG